MMPDKRTINTRYMPTLGNGYIGTTVYSDSIFLNGLYSGEGGEPIITWRDSNLSCLI